MGTAEPFPGHDRVHHVAGSSVSITELPGKKYRKQRNVAIIVCVLLAVLLTHAVSHSESQSSHSAAPVAVETAEFVASINSSKYHRPSCEHAQRILRDNLVRYSSSDDAEKDGKIPCLSCRPDLTRR